jgi:hypothetical protein
MRSRGRVRATTDEIPSETAMVSIIRESER